MKIFADIILSGKKFAPEMIMQLTGCVFTKHHKRGDLNPRLNSKEIEGYAVLTCDKDYTEAVIEKVINQYKSIIAIDKSISGIENAEFNLCVETLQGSFTISSKYLALINEYFENVNIAVLEVVDEAIKVSKN
ncbi:MAG: hypothetical protein VZQ47_04755 [Treponema sp.]|nr:hypothetical protein [Treponema sp.]MEE3434844.1 hypothetical protein [Treponema sp.]